LCFEEDFMIIQNLIKDEVVDNVKNNEKTGIKRFQPNRLNICPDCDGVCSWNTHFRAYICENSECAFMADKNGQRIWDNQQREDNLRKL